MSTLAMGFMLGLQANNPDVISCIGVGQSLSDDISDAVNKVEDALKHPSHIPAAFEAVQKVLGDFSDLSAKCQMDKLALELKALMTKDGVLAAAFRAMSHLDEFKEDLAGAVSNYKGGDFMTAGTYAGKAVSLLIEDPAPADQDLMISTAVPVTITKDETITFLKAYFSNFEVKSADLNVCLTNTDSLSADLSAAQSAIDAAKTNPRNIPAAIEATKKVFGDLSEVANACQLGDIGAALKDLATIEGLTKALQRIIPNIDLFKQDVSGAIAAFASKDFNKAGTLAGQATYLLLGELQCKAVTVDPQAIKQFLTGVFLGLKVDNPEADKCVSDAVGLQTALNNAVIKVQALLQNPFAIIPALQAVSQFVEQVRHVAERCQFDEVASKLEKLTTLAGLQQALSQAVSHASDIQENLKAFADWYGKGDMLNSGLALGKLLDILVSSA
eukprot:GILJ01020570.1.p1 GENE.GILJ01020570.1~~GILJ01020570.1.p1  ORF type:complete len:454 (+),score=120.01 GILJ01020570.1:33-1364(+)